MIKNIIFHSLCLILLITPSTSAYQLPSYYLSIWFSFLISFIEFVHFLITDSSFSAKSFLAITKLWEYCLKIFLIARTASLTRPDSLMILWRLIRSLLWDKYLSSSTELDSLQPPYLSIWLLRFYTSRCRADIWESGVYL